MPATATIVGGGLGFCMQMYINALRKLPLLAVRHRPPPPEPRSARFRVSSSRARDAPEAFRGPHAPSRASPTRIPPRARASPRRPSPSPSASLTRSPKNRSPTDPWEHVFWTGAGVAFANWNSEWEAKLRKEVDALNAERQANNARFMESIVKGESK